MATKRKNVYLYLALVCFIGLIAIFVVDGYFGVYDTIYVTTGELEQKIEPDFWQQGDYPWSTGVNWGERAFFRYEVDNRLFSTYSAGIEVSVWRMQEKVLDVLSQQVAISSFDKTELEWTIDTTELIPTAPPEQVGYEYTVVIKRGEIERRVILYINFLYPPPKAEPVPVR